MNRNEFDAWEKRVKDRAEKLWIEQGRPGGGPDRFLNEARELIAMEEVPLPTLDANEEPVIEEASLMRNLGEFPTLVDQGEEQTYPDDGVRSSDGDASDDGGVLPAEDDTPAVLPEVSQAVADLTVDDTDADAAEPAVDVDINDDGLPDQPALDPEDNR